MSEENKIISLGGTIDENAEPIAAEAPASENGTSGTLATPFETPAEAYIPTPTEVQKVVDKKPEQVKKKRGKVLKGIIITFVSLILVLAIGVGVLAFLVIYDDMPAAPTDTVDTFTVVSNTIGEFVSDSGRMEFSTSEVNGIYEKIKPMLESAVASYGAELSESFIVINDNKVTYYARVKYKGFTLPARIVLKVSYEAPHVCVMLDKITVGKITVPEKVLSMFLANVNYPKDISFNPEHAEFRYNTEALNDIFINFIRQNEFMADVESFLNWGAGIFGGSFKYENTFDITIKECQIIDNQLVFSIEKVFA